MVISLASLEKLSDLLFYLESFRGLNGEITRKLMEEVCKLDEQIPKDPVLPSFRAIHEACNWDYKKVDKILDALLERSCTEEENPLIFAYISELYIMGSYPGEWKKVISTELLYKDEPSKHILTHYRNEKGDIVSRFETFFKIGKEWKSVNVFSTLPYAVKAEDHLSKRLINHILQVLGIPSKECGSVFTVTDINS